MKHKSNGFSLAELTITLAIISIMLLIAVPAMKDTLESNQHAQAVNQLVSTLHFARSNAVSTRSVVTLCHGKLGCSPGMHWSSSLLTFLDSNTNGQLDNNEQLLRLEPLQEKLSWKWVSFGQKPYMQFKTNGTTRALNGTFTLCRDQQPKHQIVISLSGRVRTQKPPPQTAC